VVTDAEIESARREWADGHERLLEEADPHVLAQVDEVEAELRRRLGGAFTLAELVGAYLGAERWTREVVAERAAAPGWPRTLALVEAAAFHRYSLGAQDYEP
jgi:hypothetical protein